MSDFELHPRPVFRATAADQRHAAMIAESLKAAGALVTPTTVIRKALAVAAAVAAASTLETTSAS